MTLQVDEHLKQIFDAVSVSTAIGAIMGLIPSISGIITIVWMGIRIYETNTVQKILKRKNQE